MYVGCLVVCVVVEAESTHTKQTKTPSHPTLCAIRNIFQEVHMNCPSLDSLIRLHGGSSGDWFVRQWVNCCRRAKARHFRELFDFGQDRELGLMSPRVRAKIA